MGEGGKLMKKEKKEDLTETIQTLTDKLFPQEGRGIKSS